MNKKFLIGLLGRFGDCLYATTLAKQIKCDFPNCHLTWAIIPKYKSILDLNPFVDEIWEIQADDSDYDNIGWAKFETEAFKRQAKGEFDEIFLSQVSPRNWINFNGTIRGTILNSYKNPITVSAEPIVKLSEAEIANVRNFVEKYRLSKFENVVLFECSPGSGQSKVNLDSALEICEGIIKDSPKICFIISTTQKLAKNNSQIIDASELSFRENVELTKFCTLLIGCSSGISWLSTSETAKKLPTIQLLDSQFLIYAGMHYDFEINNLDNSQIIEMIDFDKQKVKNCVKIFIGKGLKATKLEFHQSYKPNVFHLKNLTKILIESKKNSADIFRFIKNFVKTNKQCSNKITSKYLLLFPYTIIYGLFYRNIKASESGFFYTLRKFVKS
jgi:hypothetical protein